ncbi:MAG: hypothetical protein HPY45_09840 [Anaerolineae bacterium]|nr:hypothetical protein [Anaerolineae bacterium]
MNKTKLSYIGLLESPIYVLTGEDLADALDGLGVNLSEDELEALFQHIQHTMAGVDMFSTIKILAAEYLQACKPDYCTIESVLHCRNCALSNYGRDCMNNPIG